MLTTREEERNRAAFLGGDNAAGKDARAFRLVSLVINVTTEAQDWHGCVIVVQHVALCGLPDQLLEDRSNADRHHGYDFPLHGRRQRYPQTLFEAFQPVQGESASVSQ